MKKLFFVPMVGSLLFCMACGSNNGSTPVGTGTGNFSDSSLQGQYVYVISGTDLANGNVPYREAGVFIADGNRNITSGTDDFSEGSGGVSSNSITGSYSLSKDGTGTLLINVGGGTLDFAITLASDTSLYLIETDSFANGSGSAERQSASAVSTTPSGTFAFRMHAIAGAQGSSSLVGMLKVSGGAISGSDDVERGGVFDNSTGAPLTLTGSLTTPDSVGRGTGTITDSANITTGFIYYIVDSNHFRFLSRDAGIIALGNAERQSGGPFSAASLSGGYAFGSLGDDNTYLGGVARVGSFTADGSGTIRNGMYDSVQDGNSSTKVTFSGSYTMASTGRAAVTLNPASGAVQQIFWMVSPTRAFLLTNDSTMVEDGTLDLQKGSFSGSTLSGQYAFVMDGFDLNNAVFVDRVGWINWNGTGGLTWNEVVNDSGAAQQSGFLSGTYSVSSNGRTTASVNGLSVAPGDLVFYLVSDSSGYMLQNDSGVEIRGNMTAQP